MFQLLAFLTDCLAENEFSLNISLKILFTISYKKKISLKNPREKNINNNKTEKRETSDQRSWKQVSDIKPKFGNAVLKLTCFDVSENALQHFSSDSIE